MAYKRIYAKNEDYIIFKELKYKLKKDADVDAIHEILMITKKIIGNKNKNQNKS